MSDVTNADAPSEAGPAVGGTLKASPATKKAVGEARWTSLIAQPVVIFAVLGAFLVWLNVADLTETERTTLAPSTLWGATLEHLSLTFVAAAIVLVITIPLGILLTRPGLRRVSAPILAIVNFGQAAPAIGLVVLLAIFVTSGYWASILALVLYAALPVLSNTMIGLRGVPAQLVEAGRGMGMSSFAVLLKVELPLAVPVMLAGIRTALVLLVGTAALAAFVNGGGLGLLIVTGVNLYLVTVLVSGALLIALLALLIDWLGQVVELIARPKGL